MSVNAKPLYRLKNVTKTFDLEKKGRVEALKNVSFDVPENKLTVVVGPSGCGKSTLLRLLAQLIEPTKGDIEREDENNNKFGFVFQEATLMPWRKVIDNVVLPLEIDGVNKNDSYRKARKLLKLLELENYEELYPDQLSGGMKQKVAIARALIEDPDVLLMDEPFSALDETMRQKLNFELLRLKEKTNLTIVFVTHNIPEAVTLADSIIVLGMKPNTVRGKAEVKLPKRTPEMLNSTKFFNEIVKIRKIMWGKK